MEGFGLLLGHLVGDYIFQDDWQATNKTNPAPLGTRPCVVIGMEGGGYITPGTAEQRDQWDAIRRRWWLGHLACAVHCTLYTFAVWLCSYWWVPWWGLVVCWLAHFPVDRWRLARVLMRWTNHEQFATGPLSPWSIILTDNIIHLAALFAVGRSCGP
jgi:hypothetical protein